MSDAVTISHTGEQGTLATGDTRPHKDLIRAHGFAWSRNIGAAGAWYVRNSRDQAPRLDRIDRLAAALNANGVTVTVELEQDSRTVDERHEARAERLEDRQTALDAKAARLAEQADATLERAPLFSGSWERGARLADEAAEVARRADASRAHQRHLESGPATMRRIETLEAEGRDIQRKLPPCPQSGRKIKADAAERMEGREVSCPGGYLPNDRRSYRHCGRQVTVTGGQVPEHGGPSAEYRAQLEARAATVAEDLDLARRHLDGLRQSGAFVQYNADTIRKGDEVQALGRWYPVLKVNAKSVTVPNSWGGTYTVSYDKVRGHKPAEQATAAPVGAGQ